METYTSQVMPGTAIIGVDDSTVEPFAEQARRQLMTRFKQAGLDHSESEDLAQECLVDLLQRLDRFDASKGPVEAWVSGFARNAVRTWYRREASRKVSETSLDSLGDSALAAPPETELDAIRHCLGELCVIDRELVYMRFSLSMSFDDIAKSTDLTPANCRKRVSRAVEKLRRDPSVRETLGL
jgi:RNA polymerase sigma factor (sigma-70 family)